MIKTYILLIVLAIIVGLAWRAKVGLNNDQQTKKVALNPTVTSSPTPQASPSASATPTISVSNSASNSAKKTIYVQPTVGLTRSPTK